MDDDDAAFFEYDLGVLVLSATCSGTSGAYRLDQADDLAFLASFGDRPLTGGAPGRPPRPRRRPPST